MAQITVTFRECLIDTRELSGIVTSTARAIAVNKALDFVMQYIFPDVDALDVIGNPHDIEVDWVQHRIEIPILQEYAYRVIN